MAGTVSLRFASPPRAWTAYPQILLSRKARLVPDGRQVPRIEAVLERVVVDPQRLARYRAVCAAADLRVLPIAYPHVLASALHLAMLARPEFPVQLLGLVHVRNRITQRRALRPEDGGVLRAWLEGHHEADRGQQFELHTEWLDEGQVVWSEICTFLARRRGRPRGASGAALLHDAADDTEPPQRARTASFRADAGIGRRYAWVSGDFNPIHLSDLAARPFGFQRAIAHGMWSLARCAAELGAACATRPCELDVAFRAPLLLPSSVMLQHWETRAGVQFALRDSQGERAYLTGSLTSTG